MIHSYLKVAWRNLQRNRLFSVIYVLGLSIGLACCLLILLYTKDELSFDRFQQKKDRLFRVTCQVIDKKNGRDTRYGEAGAVQGPAFKNGIPEVEDFVRTYEQDFLVRNAGESFDVKGTWVDKNFFQVFSFPLLSGNPEEVLSDPHHIVLTEETAKKYFGTAEAIGKTLELEVKNKFETFVVSGIAKRCPENSSIKFEMLLPFDYYAALSKNDQGYWHLLNYSTYLLLRPHINQDAVSAKMQAVYKENASEQLTELAQSGTDRKFIWGLQPFLQMHLDSQVVNEGSIKDESKPLYSYILTGIAFFILLIACINFINLTVAQSLRRSKEIGLRKVIGSSRIRLIRQFLGESYVLCFLSFALAALLAWVTLPLFNELANKQLSLEYLFDWPLVAAFTGLFLLTGFAAGFYPALVLSGLRPIDTLQNRVQVSGKNYLARGLVVFQFALATFLVIGAGVVYFQYDYMTHADLGYYDKNLLVVNVAGRQQRNKPLLSEFKTQLAALPGVQQVAERMNGRWGTTAKANGNDIGIDFERIDESYLPVLGVPLIQGRNFSKAFPSDSTLSVIVNETFVREAGWKDPIGRIVDQVDEKVGRLTIIGVVKDYHFATLKQKIKAQLFILDPSVNLGQFLIRLQPDNPTATVAAVEKVYKSLDPSHPFAYHFVEESNKRNYEAEDKWRQIISYAAILTIFISGIGLFGLTLLSINRRTKEIGVRKVLGASAWQISGMVAKNFVGLVLFSSLLATPAAWYAAGRWLDNFPYRIPLSGWIFVVGSLVPLVIAMITVSTQAIRAAGVNPAKSLRSE
jgi:putative ABC transport system permease protein